MSFLRLISLLVVCLFPLGGCTSVLSSLMVDAPNKGRSVESLGDTPQFGLDVMGVDDAFRVTVGPPVASLAVWVLEPRDEHGELLDTPQGTVMVLHGFHDRRFWMLGHARAFVKAGYRAVLVDLRGHGRSTGDYLTFGAVEKQDLSQVVDALEQRDLLAGQLGVYGISYGGGVAIQFAAPDERVAAVVSVAGIASMRDATPHFIRTVGVGVFSFVDDETFDEAITLAAQRAGFDPNHASAIDAVSRLDTPVLFAHGNIDMLVQPHHTERMIKRANADSRTMMLPLAGHVGIWFDIHGKVRRGAVAWFDQWL